MSEMTTDAFAEVIAAKQQALIQGEEYVPPEAAAAEEVDEEAAAELAEDVHEDDPEAVPVESLVEDENLSEEDDEDDEDAKNVAWVEERYGETVSPKVARTLVEQNRMIARQGTEVGALRSKVDAIEERVNQEPTPVLDRAAWREWAAEAVSEGGGEQGALQALENGGYDGYAIYLKEWMGDPEQAADATLFNNMMVVEMTAARAAAAAPVVEDSFSQASAARQIVLQRHPDLAEYEEAMNTILDEMPAGEREILRIQAESGVEGKAHVLDHLYLQAHSRNADTRVRAQVEERKQRDKASRRVKIEGTVASAEATSARTPLNEDELVVIRAKNVRRKEWGLDPLPED